MERPEIKFPKPNGIAEVRRRLKEIYQKSPSDELVNTIAEIHQTDVDDRSGRNDIVVPPRFKSSNEINP